jgi:hypothetical protein
MSAEGDDRVSEHAYVVRTVEDPSIDPIPAGKCPFTGGFILNANGYAWSIATRASDGMVLQEQLQRVGIVRT